jgi:hypothetical protein
MTDYTIVIAELFISEMILIIPVMLFMRLGGWPEGFYRIFRIKYFAFWDIDSDNSLIPHVLHWRHLKTHSPTYFDYKGKRYYTDEFNTMRRNGRPAWMYKKNNAFPIPVNTMQRQSVDAEAIRKAFNSKQLQDYLQSREGKKPESHLGRYAAIAVLALVFLFIIFLVIH